MSISLKVIVTTALLACFVCGYFTSKWDLTASLDEEKAKVKISVVYMDTCAHISYDKLSAYIRLKEIKYPEIVIKQALLESGSFTSNVFNTCNNLFGFRTASGYLKFRNWRGSVDYYADWQNRKYKKGNYYDFLRRVGYAEDSTYVQKLKQFKTKL